MKDRLINSKYFSYFPCCSFSVLDCDFFSSKPVSKRFFVVVDYFFFFLENSLEAVQATRDALTEEVTSLGRRNTELEALAKAVPLLRDQVTGNCVAE